MFRFSGGWVWSERNKKGRHERIVSHRYGHPLVNYNCINKIGQINLMHYELDNNVGVPICHRTPNFFSGCNEPI